MTTVNSRATAEQNQGQATAERKAQALTPQERLAKAKAAAERAKALRDQMKSKATQAESKASSDSGTASTSEHKDDNKAQSKEQTQSQKQAQDLAQDSASSVSNASELTSQDPGKEKLAEKLAQAKKLRDAARAKAAQGGGKEQAKADTTGKDNASKDAKADIKSKAKENKSQPTLVSSLDDIEMIEGVKEQIYTKSSQPSLWEIFIKGIWKDNPGLCQLLGMCPLLAVTTSAANALGLGMATIVVMVLSSMVISLLRKFIMSEVRIPLYVVIIATLVTVVKIEVEAYFPSLYQQLGIYLSLIVTNCIIMARAEAFAGKNNILRSTVDAIACSIGFTIVLFALGCVREIIGNGTLFMGATDVLGSWAQGLETQVISADKTLLTAILPPGGFFILALFIAGKNFLDGIAKRRAERKLEIKVLNI